MSVGRRKNKIDAGQGGKRGHSNMAHWIETAELKEFARKARRLDAKSAIRDGLDEKEAIAPRSLRTSRARKRRP